MGPICRLNWFSLVDHKLTLARDKSWERDLKAVFGSCGHARLRKIFTLNEFKQSHSQHQFNNPDNIANLATKVLSFHLFEEIGCEDGCFR